MSTKDAMRRLKTARNTLKRIEELVNPYAQDVTAAPRPKRDTWVPAEHLENSNESGARKKVIEA